MDKLVFRDIRRQLGISQSELAEALDVHPVTVNKWERGARPITKVVELAMWALVFYAERKRRPAAAPERTEE